MFLVLYIFFLNMFSAKIASFLQSILFFDAFNNISFYFFAISISISIYNKFLITCLMIYILF